jgi:phosphate transport system substrate-binding protein
VGISAPKRATTLAFAAALVAGACSGGGGATTAPASSAAGEGSPAANDGSPVTGGGTVTGSIVVSGSSTVQPISEAVSEAFKEDNPGFDYTVEGPGTGDGFKKFCAGETDISDASRTIKDTEAADCRANGVTYTELKVAIDGITILTSIGDASVTCLSFADLYALVGPESTGFAKWSDASALARELGSSTTFPDATLSITGPGEESGTFDSFIEIALAGTATARKQDATTRPDYTASANDNAIIEGIAGTPSSLGWVGFAYYEENLDNVKAIGISKDPNGTCVEPTAETIAAGQYPISRDLYIYVNNEKARANAAIPAWVDFYLADGTIDGILETVPYVPLDPGALKASQDAWAAAHP